MSTRRTRAERPTAVTVGLLYLLATIASLAAAAFVGAPGGPSELAANRSGVLAGALTEALMAMGVISIAAMFYPLLRRDAATPTQHGLSVWYLATRVSEGTVFLVAVAALLTALNLSSSDLSPDQTASQYVAVTALLTSSEYLWVAGQTIFCVGAAALSWLLLRSGRVPRWLAVWGLVAAPLMLVGGLLLPVTADPNSWISSVLYAPMGVQEMVLAVWLIGWGFKPIAADTGGTLEGSASWTHSITS